MLEDGDPTQTSVCMNKMMEETHFCLHDEGVQQDASTTHPPKISGRIRTHPDASGRIRNNFYTGVPNRWKTAKCIYAATFS